MVICDGYKGLKWIATCDWKISSCLLSVMCATCLYQLESPSRLTVHIVDWANSSKPYIPIFSWSMGLIEWKLRHFEWLRVGLISSMQWNFHRCDLWNPIVAVCYSDIIVSIEIVLCLTYFCREWCEWYVLNVIWWSVSNICATYMLHVNTTGLRLFHYCITTYVSTCDAWSLM
jgi:hypothetical protein